MSFPSPRGGFVALAANVRPRRRRRRGRMLLLQACLWLALVALTALLPATVHADPSGGGGMTAPRWPWSSSKSSVAGKRSARRPTAPSDIVDDDPTAPSVDDPPMAEDVDVASVGGGRRDPSRRLHLGHQREPLETDSFQSVVSQQDGDGDDGDVDRLAGQGQQGPERKQREDDQALDDDRQYDLDRYRYHYDLDHHHYDRHFLEPLKPLAHQGQGQEQQEQQDKQEQQWRHRPALLVDAAASHRLWARYAKMQARRSYVQGEHAIRRSAAAANKNMNKNKNNDVNNHNKRQPLQDRDGQELYDRAQDYHRERLHHLHQHALLRQRYYDEKWSQLLTNEEKRKLKLTQRQQQPQNSGKKKAAADDANTNANGGDLRSRRRNARRRRAMDNVQVKADYYRERAEEFQGELDAPVEYSPYKLDSLTSYRWKLKLTEDSKKYRNYH